MSLDLKILRARFGEGIVGNSIQSVSLCVSLCEFIWQVIDPLRV